jgi:hypothetical protein
MGNAMGGAAHRQAVKGDLFLPGTKLLWDNYVTALFDRQAIGGYMPHGAWNTCPSRYSMPQSVTTTCKVDTSRIVKVVSNAYNTWFGRLEVHWQAKVMRHVTCEHGFARDGRSTDI